MMELGFIFEIWKADLSLKAYQDHIGRWHDGYIVEESFVIELVEKKTVLGTWGRKEYEGWKAIDKNGREFTNNWFSFPDDSMTPTYFWDCLEEEDGEIWQPVDAMQAVNSSISPYVTPDGQRAIPSIAIKCPEHDYYFREAGGHCFKCHLQTIKDDRERREKEEHPK